MERSEKTIKETLVGSRPRVMTRQISERKTAPENTAQCSFEAEEIAALIRHLCDEHGVHPPFLFRFEGTIRSRLEFIHNSFRNAMRTHAYNARFRYLYPVKVCHRHSVLQSVLSLGNKDDVGLEVGSRTELAMILACEEARGRMIVYNGHKDRTDLAAVNRAMANGYSITLIVDSMEAIEELIRFAKDNAWDPSVGMRIATGALGVENLDAKFGSTSTEAREGLRLLQKHGFSHQLRMLHIHSGSASTAVLEATIRESLLIFYDLKAAGASNLDTLDCGGGMGAFDRENRSTIPEASSARSVYPNALVSCLAATCRELGMRQPNIFLESGRALLAQHAMLVMRAISVKDERAGAPAVVFCNVSIFRSMLDVFLEKNKYFLLPIQGLGASPKLEVKVADLTADPDGILDQYEGGKGLLSLPSFAPRREEPFFLAAMGVGAYQDVLGNSHNGFGKVCEVFLSAQQGASPMIARGSTLAEQLRGEGFQEEHISRLRQYSLDTASTYLQ